MVSEVSCRAGLSLMSNRKTICLIKNSSSSMSNITLGIPQGLVLDPVPFLLYINGMHKSSNQWVLFILLIVQQFLLLTVTLTMFMPLWIGNWLELIYLAQDQQTFLNVSKTLYMTISNQKNAFNIKIRHSIFTKVSTGKFLGFTLDENLTWPCKWGHY